MNNFPFYNHFAIKIIFDGITINKDLVTKLGKKIIEELNVNVVKECDYEFTAHGYTKIYILSQSHLIFHTWPESNALHVDLMTCDENINKEMVENVFSSVQAQDIKIQELIY